MSGQGFEGAIAAKTERDNEFKIIVVDQASGASATKKLTVIGEGDAVTAGTNDTGLFAMVKDSAGNADILEKDADGNLPVAVNKVSDGTNDLGITADGEAKVRIDKAQGADGASAPAEAVQIAGKDPAGNLQVLATDTAGQIKAVVVPPSNLVLVSEFFIQPTLAPNTSNLFFYVVPTGKVFTGGTVLAGGRGATQVRWGISDDGIAVTTVKGKVWQQPKENHDHNIQALQLLGDGTKAIFIEVTNTDGASSEVTASLQGFYE